MSLKRPALLRELSPRVIAVYLFVSFGSFNFGFDLAWWSACLGLQPFRDHYGVVEQPGEPAVIPSSWQSVGTGTPNAGMALGCILGGYCCHWVGRKWTIGILAVISAVGVIIQVSIPSYWAIIAGRTINGISMGMEANVIPMYSAELAPPAIRGSLVNLYQWWQIVGNITSASCIYGTSMHLSGQWKYKPVMIVQMAIPIILALGVWFLPESPRWLLFKDRRSDARKALGWMRQGRSTDDETDVELELLDAALQEQIEHNKATSYLDCFRTSNLRRTLIAILVQLFQQIQGNSFMNNYLVIFLQRIGISNSLQIYIAQNATQLGGITLAFYFSDRVGRRPILALGALLMGALMWVVAGLGAYSPDGVTGNRAQGCVAAILIYQALAGGCWGSCTWITMAEAPTAQLREKTIMMATFVSFCMVLLITYVNPYLQDEGYGNLGARIGFVYGGCSFLALGWVALFLPELKGRSLEELDELFQRRVSTWKFKSYRCSGIGSQITKIQDENAGGEGDGTLTASQKKEEVMLET